MNNKYTLNYTFVLILVLTVGCGGSNSSNVNTDPVIINNNDDSENISTLYQDFLTPNYYLLEANDSFILETNKFLINARKQQFHHPFEDKNGNKPYTSTPNNSKFTAEKNTGNVTLHHSAVDLYLQNAKTSVNIYAAHDGYISTTKLSGKYRHYLSITKDVNNIKGVTIGKLVTIYAHIDLDLDESEQIWMNNIYVNKGELISKHLYANTAGGPHLHFEIRYYRLNDDGTETFYGIGGPMGNPNLTQSSAGDYSFGAWDPEVGYGFGNPENHGLFFY